MLSDRMNWSMCTPAVLRFLAIGFAVLLVPTGSLADPADVELEKLVTVLSSSGTARIVTKESTYLVDRPGAFLDGVHHSGVYPPHQANALKNVVGWESISEIMVERDFSEEGSIAGCLLGEVAYLVIVLGDHTSKYDSDSDKWVKAAVFPAIGTLFGYLAGKDMKHWKTVYSK